MALALHRAVTSPEAIEDSIKTDNQVCRWFSHVIVQPSVKEQLKKAESIFRLYKNLSYLIVWQGIFYLVLIAAVIGYGARRDLILLVPLALGAVLAARNIFLRKKIVAQISLAILGQDFSPEELSQMTLFHLGEAYGRKYKIPTLVDAIYASDRALRRAVIWIFVLTCFIYPLPYWETFFWVIAGYFAIRMIINLAFFYRQLS